ncbi:unnamed protein product [Candidatus Protochlamydia amoebophila UWE25]|uniref:aminomethyltransferase n=2 Tax=Candidatus Protochlamydia amoebophila TaxID=362787 RepID=A0A2P9H9D0_PARUW|nr:unnamed protein product [Candidatus Protochlamydia amoebophila UWE25]
MMQTALYSRHLNLQGKMIDFAGWSMPIHYKGILAEHQAVREKVGLFDVSHMGKIDVRGPDAERFLDYLSTNRIMGKGSNTATYTVWCNSQGGSIDDVIIYRHSSTYFFVIVNASNRQKDLAHMQKQAAEFQVTIQPQFENSGILALQGPFSFPLVDMLFPGNLSLKPMSFTSIQELDQPLILSRTGYTGAGGFEFYGTNEQIISLWDRLLNTGKTFGIEPIGLGARDTLRLEMGFALYGHEISDTIAPTESVSAWAVKFDKTDFLGKQALKSLEATPIKRMAYGVKLKEPGIARQGYPIFKDGIRIGEVTSGSISPSLNEAVALILVDTPLKIKQDIKIQIRQTQCHAEVVQLPFIRKNR